MSSTVIYICIFIFYFIFYTSLLEYNCFTMPCQFLLYNKVNQPYAYIYPHIPSLLSLPPTPSSHPSKSSQITELISLCYAVASHQLSILHLVVYICQCYSPFAPAFPSSPVPVSSSPFSTSASLFLPCHQVHQCHFFYIPYICISIWYLFFSS